MNFVPSGIILPYEATFDLPGLFAAMTVYDLTVNPAVIVAGPAAMENTTGATYVGKFTAQPGKAYLIYKAIYTDGTFVTLDPNYSQSSETIQGGGVDISYVVPNIALTSKTFVALPNVAIALRNWLQPMVFGIISKTVKNFQNKEDVTLVNFLGVWQPFTPAQLKMKPQGQRDWSWFMLHAEPGLVLKDDDVVEYNLVQYRVMETNDYAAYGYNEYHLVEDYIGSGPDA